MRKIVSMGELLIDFIPKQKGVLLKEVTEFIKMPGGAPANVAATVSKLGGQSAFMGQVGRDAFGDFLKQTLIENGIDVTHLYQTEQAKTALAFVSLSLDGQRDFMFYRNPSADQLFSKDLVNEDFLKSSIFHFCSVSLTDDPIKYAHLFAINSLKKNQGFISFDPNIRLPLWKDHIAYKKVINEFIPYANLLKISDDELYFITDIIDKEKAIHSLFLGDVAYIILTKGKDGAELYTKNSSFQVSGFDVKTIDTTGAGDAFIGAILYQLSQKELIEDISDQEFKRIIRFANACAALTTTRLGAMSAIPTMDEIESLMNIQPIKL